MRTTDTFSDTCKRILETKLGITELYLEQLYSFDDPSRDHAAEVVSIAYYALVNPSKFQLCAGAMANDVQWFPKKITNAGI